MLKDSLLLLARSHRRQRQDFLVIETGRLEGWAAEHGLSQRQACEQALMAGIFPDHLERNFPSLTAVEQLRLFQTGALVAGLGGLGGYQATLLARLGVGRLLLADGDCFTPSNLNRQLLATHDSLGCSKARLTAEFIIRLNPALEVQILETYLDAPAFAAALQQVDLGLDALDSLTARRQFLSAARQTGKPVIHGAVLGQDGQVTTILPTDDLTFVSRYLNSASPDIEPPPVLAPSVALVASLQVQEAMRLRLHRPLAYHGRLAYLDGDTGRLEFFPLQ